MQPPSLWTMVPSVLLLSGILSAVAFRLADPKNFRIFVTPGVAAPTRR